MSQIAPSIVFQLGTGGIGGFIVGYAVKKLSKLIAIVIGLFLIALIYLGTQGIVSINYAGLWDALSGSFGKISSAASWLVGVVSLLPFAGSFVVGLLLGFKIG
jgi:uncharacterized membrane protein (Fun14 family)